MKANHRTGIVLAVSLLVSSSVFAGNAYASGLPTLAVAAVDCEDFDAAGALVGANFVELVGAGSVVQEPTPSGAISARCTSDPGSTGLMAVTATFADGVTQTVMLPPGQSAAILPAKPALGAGLSVGGAGSALRAPGILRLTGKLQGVSIVSCTSPLWPVNSRYADVICVNRLP